jgi:hypothetical protein
MDPHGFCALMRDRGWTPEQFERWFTDSVSRLLLAATEVTPVKAQRRLTSASRQATPTCNQQGRTS